MRERATKIDLFGGTGGVNPRLDEKRLLCIEEAMMYVGLGRNKAMEFLESINARRNVGRRCLYDRVVIDKYFDEQMQEV